MEKNIKVARLFGIGIYLHYSWFLIVILLAYELSAHFFPARFPGLDRLLYLGMGLVAALLLFVSVLFHELSHSLVAKWRKIRIEKISLFFFGGIAQMDEKGITALTELLMALAGPLFSLAFAFLSAFLIQFFSHAFFVGILFYLSQINFILALFNLAPGFPLDGGRAFRALIWMITGNYEKATYIASRGGKFFGGLLVFFGFFNIISGNMGGLWMILIGAFLYFLAEMSYEQVIIKKSLFRVPVKKIMLRKFAFIKPEMTVDRAINEVFVHAEQEAFPVIENKKFVGVVSLERIKNIPFALRAKTRIKSVMHPRFIVKKIKATTNVYDALVQMAKKDIPIIPVIEKGRLVGILTRDTVMRFMRLMLGGRGRR